ncbi:MAG: histidine triad nucleotide-binding protein [Patescibacteria group bacterium]
MCIFCQIVNKEIPAELVFTDDLLVVIKDINPKAPIHLLLIPKKHLKSVAQMTEEDIELIGRLFYRAKLLAQENGIAESGYKLVINNGRDGGQAIDHLHLHLLGGARLEGVA